jgi:hypothetical protein
MYHVIFDSPIYSKRVSQTRLTHRQPLLLDHFSANPKHLGPSWIEHPLFLYHWS